MRVMLLVRVVGRPTGSVVTRKNEEGEREKRAALLFSSYVIQPLAKRGENADRTFLYFSSEVRSYDAPRVA